MLYKKGIRHGYARAQRDGSVVMIIPYRLRDDKGFYADLFAKAQKLQKKLTANPAWDPITDGHVMIFGDWVDRKGLPDDLDMYLSHLLRDYIAPLCDLYATVLGKKYTSISIKKLRSKWGSCSWDQKLVFNRALVHLPLLVVRYVVIHEIVHLEYKHHQRSFWSLVAALMPDYQEQEKVLK
jgi:predicted metal-dependent hydrolase